MKNKLSFVLIALLFAGCLMLAACRPPITFSISYSASEGGTISGSFEQTVEFGQNAQTVTAVPNESYRFVKWSDTDDTNPVRTDINVSMPISAIAEFAKITQIFNYKYNNATENNYLANTELKYGMLNQASLIVPQRVNSIFNGWFLDKEFTVQVADEFGNMLAGNEIFNGISENFYAKWTSIEKITYKILLVFVTEIQGTFESAAGGYTDVHYVMSDLERQICEMIPTQLSNRLNEAFAGLVNFEIDYYFTTEAVDESGFSNGGIASGTRPDYWLFANNISEVREMSKAYRSVLTTIGLNDYDHLLHSSGGVATAKYGCIFIESLFTQAMILEEPIDNILDLNYMTRIHPGIPYWEVCVLSHYTHELAHTMEQHINLILYGEGKEDIYPYHDALWYYYMKYRNLETGYIMLDNEITYLYLLNQIIVDDKAVGIPYWWWETTYLIYYDTH